MPNWMYTNGTREEHQRIEIDFHGSSVIAIEDYSEVKRVPFFKIARVEYDDGIVYIDDRRGDFVE